MNSANFTDSCSKEKKSETSKITNKEEVSSEHASKSNLYFKHDPTKIFTFNADLIKQKTLLKKRKQEAHCNINLTGLRNTNQKIFLDNELSRPANSSQLHGFIDDDLNTSNKDEIAAIQAKLESSHLSLFSGEASLENFTDILKGNTVTNLDVNKPNSEKSNLFIVSRHGTVRGSLNHVKTSLKQIFKESQITNPITNAQLNLAPSNTSVAKQNEAKPFLHCYLAVN